MLSIRVYEKEKTIKNNCMCVSCKFWGKNFLKRGVAFELDFRVIAWFEQIEAGLMD